LETEIRYHHPEKTLAMLPTRPEVTDTMIAPFFRTSAGTYTEIKSDFAEQARRSARELLENARFAGLVDRLPFEPGTTVLGLGDSITDDLLSWFEVLRYVLAERCPEDGIRLINAGISGDTTSRLLGRILYALEEEPAWALILIGTNDVPFVREPSTKALVSLEETAKNLNTLRNLSKAKGVRLAWMTPPPAIEERMTGTPAAEPVWRNRDLTAVAKLVREVVVGEDLLVDLWEVFGDPTNPEYLLPDGLHPSLAGQKAIVQALVGRLSESCRFLDGREL
jgi:lysophospholipase L1-like esterase